MGDHRVDQSSIYIFKGVYKEISFRLMKLYNYKTGPSNPKHSRMTDSGPRQPEVTSPPKISVLLRELLSKVSADWENIGLILELKEGELRNIRSDHDESEKCFREMLKLWLNQVEPPPTWSAIIEAIDTYPRYKSLAKELRKKYC